MTSSKKYQDQEGIQKNAPETQRPARPTLAGPRRETVDETSRRRERAAMLRMMNRARAAR
jgi:hypothetical protein